MYYHGTHYYFEDGFELKSKNEYTSNESVKELESLFEEMKPTNKISRKEAIFLCISPDDIDSCGGYTDVIYNVNANNVEKSDLAWYSKAEEYLENNEIEKAKDCAKKYWSGQKFDIKSHSCYELRTKSAKIINIFELNINEEELTKLKKIEIEDFLKTKTSPKTIKIKRKN